MKTLYILIAFALGLSPLNAQISIETKVPSKVRDAFTKHYPDVKNEKWGKDGSNYEAEFVVNKTESSAVYDSDGNFIESVVELKASELPKAVIDYVATNLNGKKIKEAGKITDAAGKISYKAEVGREDYIFDSDCSFVRKDDEKGKNDDQDY